jgi:predicted regulator of Ras-like GTPase activity (Roadblock/LC7/MglB family)
MALRWLGSLGSIPQVMTAVLVADDGLEIESVGGDSIAANLLAAETATLVRATTSAGSRLGGGRLFRYSLTTDQFEMITVRAGTQYSLTVAAQRGADLRQIQVEMARLALQLVQELG